MRARCEEERREGRKSSLYSRFFSHSRLCKAVCGSARFIGSRGRPRSPDWLPEAQSPGGSADERPGTAAIGRAVERAPPGWGRAGPGKKERERAVGEGGVGEGSEEGRGGGSGGGGGGPSACREGPRRPGLPRSAAAPPPAWPGAGPAAHCCLQVGYFAGEFSLLLDHTARPRAPRGNSDPRALTFAFCC